MGLGYALWVASLRTSDLDEAQRLAAEADELLRATDSPMGIAHNVEGRGIIAYDRDELADAAAFVAEAIELFARFGNPGCSAHALEAAAADRRRKRPRRGRNRAPRRRRRTPSPQWCGPQAMGDPRTPRRNRRSHRAPFSRRARGGAQRGKAAHPRVCRPRRARRALHRRTRVTILRVQELHPWRARLSSRSPTVQTVGSQNSSWMLSGSRNTITDPIDVSAIGV